MTALVLEHLAEHSVPTPSFILSSGRGLQLVWLHDGIPMVAQRRWDAVQRTIGEQPQPFAPDPSARHAATVRRLAGTRNSRSGTLVRATHLPQATRDGVRWSFDDLARKILPVCREKLDTRTKPLQRKVATSLAGIVARAASSGVKPTPEQTNSESYDHTLVNADCDLVG